LNERKWGWDELTHKQIVLSGKRAGSNVVVDDDDVGDVRARDVRRR
jgi:hypothetical protein